MCHPNLVNIQYPKTNAIHVYLRKRVPFLVLQLVTQRTLVSTWKEEIVAGRTTIGILGSIWAFQVLFGPSRY